MAPALGGHGNGATQWEVSQLLAVCSLEAGGRAEKDRIGQNWGEVWAWGGWDQWWPPSHIYVGLRDSLWASLWH